MASRFRLLLTCLALFVACGCGSNSGVGQQPARGNANQQGGSSAAGAQPPPPAPPADKAGGSCALLEASEIASVQGAQVRGVTPSDRQSGGFAVSQCYYTVSSADGTKNLSVHVEVTENAPGSPNKNALGDLWREKFQEAKEKKKADKPRPVSGVGEGAYWVGNAKTGALYVLQKDKLIRVSVGGPEEEAAKIEKSKSLAALALKRLT